MIWATNFQVVSCVPYKSSRRADSFSAAIGNALVDCRLHRMSGVIGLQSLRLWQMRSLGVQPDIVSCNAVITACDRAGVWQAALSAAHGYAMSNVTCNALLSSCAVDWLRGLSLLVPCLEIQKLTSRGPSDSDPAPKEH